MWLINTETLDLHYFNEQNAPTYAILSHRWETQEVTFRHLYEVNKVLGSTDETAEDHAKMLYELGKFPYLSELQTFRLQHLATMQGWRKITAFCDKARAMHYEWGWVDTCCIDKSSSAELQEAVNSMYRWYRNSHVCLVYMSDVTASDVSNREGRLDFEHSKWFSRGWTLQELLAPQSLLFFDSEWIHLGDKCTREEEIAATTGIAAIFLTNQEFITENCCFAEKMSWVADRETTREEDLVYCMLGLFGVNMPLIYGEGREMAFVRFQEEVMKNTDDDASMFIWNHNSESKSAFRDAKSRRGLLAMLPSQFSAESGRPIFPVINDFWRSWRGPAEAVGSLGRSLAVELI